MHILPLQASPLPNSFCVHLNTSSFSLPNWPRLRKSFEYGLFFISKGPNWFCNVSANWSIGNLQQKYSGLRIYSPFFPLPTDKQPQPQTFTFKFSHRELHIGSIFPLKLQKTVESSSLDLRCRESPPLLTLQGTHAFALKQLYPKRSSSCFSSPFQPRPTVAGQRDATLDFPTSFTSLS